MFKTNIPNFKVVTWIVWCHIRENTTESTDDQSTKGQVIEQRCYDEWIIEHLVQIQLLYQIWPTMRMEALDSAQVKWFLLWIIAFFILLRSHSIMPTNTASTKMKKWKNEIPLFSVSQNWHEVVRFWSIFYVRSQADYHNNVCIFFFFQTRHLCTRACSHPPVSFTCEWPANDKGISCFKATEGKLVYFWN